MSMRQNIPLTLRPAFQRTLLNMVILAAIPINDVAAEDYFDPDTVERHSGQRANLDLSTFSRSGGQAAGVYNADVYLNDNFVGSKSIRFEPGAKGLQPLLMKADFMRWGAKENATPAFVKISPAQEVTNIAAIIPQAQTRFDLSQQRLNVSIPQEYVR